MSTLNTVTCRALPNSPVLDHIENGRHYHKMAGKEVECTSKLYGGGYSQSPERIAKCFRCGVEVPWGDYPDFPGWPYLQLPTHEGDANGTSCAPPGRGACKYCRQDISDERHGINPAGQFGVDVIE